MKQARECNLIAGINYVNQRYLELKIALDANI